MARHARCRGTFLNLPASLAAAILRTQAAPTAVGPALHFAPVPNNAFLFLAVGRLPACSALQMTLAIKGLAMTIVVSEPENFSNPPQIACPAIAVGLRGEHAADFWSRSRAQAGV